MQTRSDFFSRLTAVVLLVFLSPACQSSDAGLDPSVAFSIPDALLIPEGIAYDAATGDFFVGSTYKRKVVRVTPDGTISDFAPNSSVNVWGVVGMRVDVQRRLLWLAASHAGDGMPMVDMDSAEEGSSGLFGFEIDTGDLRYHQVLDDEDHFLNDLTLTGSGVVFVTDSRSRWLYRFDPTESSGLVPFVDLSSYGGGPNGIDITPDERFLYVAVGRGVVRVDISAGTSVSVLDGESGSAVIDGLYYDRGTLLGVTPFGAEHSVIRLHLNDEGDNVTSQDGLLSGHPLLEQPTTAALVGDTLFLVANSHLQTFRSAWSPAGPDTTGVGLREVSVLRIPIPDSGTP